MEPVPPRARLPQADSVADFRSQVQMQGISETASRLLLASWRPGTQRVYGSQYKVFTSWCSRRGSDPLDAGLELILDFLAHLFEEGKEYKTVCVYR